MRTVLIGAVGSTEIVLRAMNEAGYPPVIFATFEPEIGRRRHADYVDLAPMVDPSTEVAYVESISDPAFIAKVASIEPTMLFVIGWSQLIREELSKVVAGPCVGFHPTLLPALRGRAAIGWTILLGLEETGATLFEINEGVDSGPILAQTRFRLSQRETVASLGDKLSHALDGMIRDLLPRLANGNVASRPQPVDGVTYCARRTAADSLIDWTQSAVMIDRLIRASSEPYAGAFTYTRKRKVIIWSAEPIKLPNPHFAAAGQIVDYIDDKPVVLCGDGEFLRVTRYDAGGTNLIGQVRFRERMGNED